MIRPIIYKNKKEQYIWKNDLVIFLFKEIVKILLKLETFIEFDINKSKYNFSENEYNEFKSRYLSFSDEKIKKEKLYVLADVDFELELIYSNKINVHYILELLKK
nr:hypothetical protein [Spiroplasma citri]